MLARFVIMPAFALALAAANDPAKQEWRKLFNGRNLDGWTPKINGFGLGENHARTFRVEKAAMKVSYDGYTEFGERFGHIFYKDKFSYYRLAVEYRFVGDQAPKGPGWAIRNSGVMIHSQDPATMGKDQNFPISIEVQFLGGLSNGKPRSTANLCTPGTNVVRDGNLFTPHCLNSTSKTYDGDQWVRVEVEVLGSERVRHVIDGESVLSYEQPQIGGGAVNNFAPESKQDGKLLSEGYIALQSESHPIEFRKVEILDLEGCKDPAAKNFKSYFVKENKGRCKY